MVRPVSLLSAPFPGSRALLWLALTGLLLGLSCNDSKGASTVSAESVYNEIRGLADPVAEVSAQVAVTNLTNEASSLDAVTDEIGAQHASRVQAFKDALCTALSKSAKDADDGETDRIRATGKQALRDSFILKYIQAAAATSPEKQTEIAQSNDIKSVAVDGSELTGSAALKDASLQSADGSLRIPPIDTAEYVKYTDWLGKNSSLSGLITILTKDYEGMIQDCALG
jgi:hypothetical protein